MTNNKRLFLYIDILGFSELVKDDTIVKKVYEIIDRLNVFRHKTFFKCIVFSDTLLVYSERDWRSKIVPSEAIMWMCEFTQDLFYRFIRLNLHFRAILTEGEFSHSKMKNIEAFYGEALVRTYTHEASLTGMGLFLDRNLMKHSNIFKSVPYSAQYEYVCLMQTLEDITQPNIHYPIDKIHIILTGMESLLIYDFVYLWNIFLSKNDVFLSPKIRSKYIETWALIRKRHAPLLDTLEKHCFNLNCISALNWEAEIARFQSGNGFHG